MLRKIGPRQAPALLDRTGEITVEYAILAAIFVAVTVAAFPPLAQKVVELLGRVQL